MPLLRWLIFIQFSFLFFCIGTRASPAYGGSISECHVQFVTTGEPVLVKIVGKSEEACKGSFNLDKDTLSDAKFKMPLTALSTGIALRDRHLRENYLHTDKFPEATVSITNASSLREQLKGSASDFSAFSGNLTIHGVTKPITDGQYKIKGKAVEAKFTVDLQDFGIDKPAFMGVKIVEKIHITVEFKYS